MLHQQRWTPEKIRQRLALIEPLVYRQHAAIAPFRYRTVAGPTDSAVQIAIHASQADIEAWEIIRPETYWVGWLTDFVLRGQFSVSAEFPPNQPLALYLPLGDAGDFSHPEALIYVDGKPYAACDRHHQEILLKPEWCDGQPHELALHGWTGLGGMMRGESQTRLFMRQCEIVQIDQPTRDFIVTARTALGVANLLDAQTPAWGQLLNGLDAAFKLLDTREPFGAAFYDSVPFAYAALREAIGQAGAPLDVELFAAGHAHIDVAWLWTLGQTRRKAERTFHTVLRLMEQFPDYKFTQSQPQLYDYICQDQPELFAAIKQRVADGRWEPIGGMWVEADCNISGGESLARQFVIGRKFFRDQFGADTESPILWLPDVFGYAWNLPQLIKEAGLEYFFTIKIGWSQYNRMPWDSFWWQGLDGTRVLTHFSPTPADGDHQYASTYNAKATPESALGTWTNFQQKEQSHDLLMAFGYGDGGGGPTREMLENIGEMAAFPALPRVKHAKAIDFFRALEANSGDQLPIWKGELYLEYHRGTYTTQARNKRANRKSEFLLHDAEFLATCAMLVSEFQYPQTAFNRAWELVCLNQFHDIIPGTSIAPVYIESQAQYAEVRQSAEKIQDDALNAIADAVNSGILFVNPTGMTQRALVFVPEGSVIESAFGNQEVEGGLLIHCDAMQPYSVNPSPGNDFTWYELEVSPRHLENEFLRVELNDAGDITRIYDKEHAREVLPPGAIANQLQAFEDRPKAWDAWDIDIFYDDKLWLADSAESITVIEAGILRATLEIKRRILNSTVTQRISLTHFVRNLDFDTHVEWNEKHILLKVAFPVDILTPTATYEVQWGHVERPTHRNTSWDWARFETAAQKWVDVSEGDYGVSLLNDCKYGHDIQDVTPAGTVMRISLLRSPTLPDPTADQGNHQFRYSLLPHAGPVGAETIRQAYLLNNPPFLFEREAQGKRKKDYARAALVSSLIASENDNVVIETIKSAEDGNGLIVRIYESLRQRGTVSLSASFPLAAAWRTNLIEENQEQLAIDADWNTVEIPLRPFQIVTLRLHPQSAVDGMAYNESQADQW